MPTGTIKSFDEDSGKGYIKPTSGGGEIPFDLDSMADHQTGDVIHTGEQVTYEVEGALAGDFAINVRRVAPRGYE